MSEVETEVLPLEPLSKDELAMMHAFEIRQAATRVAARSKKTALINKLGLGENFDEFAEYQQLTGAKSVMATLDAPEGSQFANCICRVSVKIEELSDEDLTKRASKADEADGTSEDEED